MFRELGQMRPSKSSLDRLPKALGRQWEGQREAFEAALREGGEVPDEAVTVAVSLDGAMVPMKDAKRANGSAGYQEGECQKFRVWISARTHRNTHTQAEPPRKRPAYGRRGGEAVRREVCRR